jgi:uncharacterized repeat protein (TIGR03803 family)
MKLAITRSLHLPLTVLAFHVLSSTAFATPPTITQQPQITSFALLSRFQGANVGANPQASLIQGTDGRLYGMTFSGGINSFGTVFAVKPDGTGFTTLYLFNNGNDGSGPAGNLIQGADGRLYGTAQNAGANGAGTVFATNSNGTGFTTLYSFNPANGNDGSSPAAGLIQGTDSRLYGTTFNGGANGFGTVFAVNPDGTGFTTLYSFTSGNDGANPTANLIEGTDGRLYGTAEFGGANSFGTVFALNLNGTGFTTLYSFTSGSDGALPSASLIQGTDGRLYGTAQSGGTIGFGTVFAVIPDGTGFTTLYSFTDGNDGANPIGSLIQATDGRLYGTAESGGTTGNGTMFALNPDGTGFATLYSFTGGNDGANPQAGLIQGTDGRFYGTTANGGAGNGTVFAISTNSAIAGTTATITVAAMGTAPLSYQWKFNGVDIPGATSATLTLTNITAANAGSYTVVVSNLEGSVPSNPVSLTVILPSPPPAPVFAPAPGTYSTAQPVFITSASATHIYYTVNGSTPTTASTLYTGPVSISVTTTLRAIGVDAGGSSPVTGGTYTILPPSAPVFSPAPGTYGTAQSVLITSVQATHIYYTTDGSTPTTASTLYTGPVLVSMTTTLRAIGVDGAGLGPVTSGTYTILPPSAPVFSPTAGIYSTAQSVSITSANAASIYYTTDGSTPTTASTLYTGAISISTTTTLRAIGVDAAGSSLVTSGTYTIGISPTPPVIHSITATPGILTPPDNQLVPVTITVNTTDAADPHPVSVIIAVSSNEAADHDVDWKITGPLTLNLRAERDQQGDGIIYTITILTSDIFGLTTTGTTQVIVPKDSDALKDRPDITADPKSQAVTEGGNVTFTVSVAPALPVTYQWRFNHQAITGATGATLTLPNVTLASAGDYTVVVTNSNGSTTSDEADLKVLPLPPVITVQPISQTVNGGENITFTVTATSDAPLTYQWEFNGRKIDDTDADDAALKLTKVESSDAGAYSVVVSNAGGSTTSTAATLSVTSPH